VSATEFAKTASEIYAPAYPENAKQILAYAGITKGSCIELGCGPGFLGLALAQMSELNICLIDKDPEMLEIAQQNIIDRGFESRVSKLLADVTHLPVADNSVQLVVSRGSMFYWDEPVKVFNEIHRILAPGGKAFIGAGFGNAEIKRQISEAMDQKEPGWSEAVFQRIGPGAPEKWRKVLTQTDIPLYYIDHLPEVEMWIKFSK
jgi:ubiquinone/menaquinone biosynthesis C-methylase UbiE